MTTANGVKRHSALEMRKAVNKVHPTIYHIKNFLKLAQRNGVQNAFLFTITSNSNNERYYDWYLRKVKEEAEDGLILKRIDRLDMEMYLDANDTGISRKLYLTGFHERKASTVFEREFVRLKRRVNSPIVLEIGGNIGFYSLIEAQVLSGNGEIFVVEPHPHNIDLFRKNMAHNGYTDMVDIMQGVISESTGDAEIKVSSSSNCHSMEHTGEGIFKGEYLTVPSWTVLDFLDEKGLSVDDINVIRMDVEGHEGKIFKKLDKVLQSDTPKLVYIEMHDNLIKNEELNEVLSQIKRADFKFVYACNDNPVDGAKEVIDSFDSIPENLRRRRNVQVIFKKGY